MFFDEFFENWSLTEENIIATYRSGEMWSFSKKGNIKLVKTAMLIEYWNCSIGSVDAISKAVKLNFVNMSYSE